MKISKPLLYNFLFLFIAISLFVSCDTSKKKEGYLESVTNHINETFKIKNYIDTSGQTVELDFAKSRYTIIDFWINECPPCNKEMSQFAALIKGKEKDISIESVSLSNFSDWKSLFTKASPRYFFLGASLPNWHHAALKSVQDPELKNNSIDRLKEISDSLGVTFFPACFVVNQKGIIVARPLSAVEYIKRNFP